MTDNSYLEISKDIIAKQGLASFISYLAREIYRIVIRQHFFSSYSQNWEDLFITKQFPSHYRGFYIDIGAHHPARLSNTYSLYLHGWMGITVEPNRQIEKYFLSIRPLDRFISAGIGPKKQILKFYSFIIPAISTFSRAVARNNQAKGFSLKEILEIPVLTPTDLYKFIPETKKIDFLSLDTEGWDYQILKSWNWKSFSPQFICVETPPDHLIEKLLNRQKYRRVFSNSVNEIYRRF